MAKGEANKSGRSKSMRRERSHWIPASTYRRIYSRVPRLCVDVVIKTSRGVLLSRRSSPPYVGWWHLPGGRLYRNEKLAAAVRRVCRDELGLNAKTQELSGVIEYLREPPVRGVKIHNVSAVFIVRASGVPRGSWQARTVAFFKSLPLHTLPVVREFLVAKGLAKG